MSIKTVWIGFLIILSVFAIAFTGCEDSKPKEKQRTLYGAKSLDEAIAVFFRIQAKYEIIKTGEIIEFDFVQSCYNRDVPGSFTGIIVPTTMFKPTKEGQAIAIGIPRHYCERGLNNMEIIQKRDTRKMPKLAWYPDVNDLSFAYVYITNDAYTGPRAKVKFLDYQVSKANRKDFYAWKERAEAEYKQVGQIPGPYGCVYYISPTELPCRQKQFIGMDKFYFQHPNYKALAVPSRADYITKLEWPEGAAKLVREYLDTDVRYYCINGINQRTGKKNDKYMASIPPHKMESYSPLAQQVNKIRLDIIRIRYGKTQVHLDPELLLTGKGERTVWEVYPVVEHRHWRNKTAPLNGRAREGRVSRIIENHKWKGFAILDNSYRDIVHSLPQFQTPNYQGPNHTILYLNDDLICYDGFGDIYDLEQGLTIFRYRRD